MNDIKHINPNLKITDGNRPKQVQKNDVDENLFNDELKKSLDKIEKMGSDIDVASSNLTNAQSDISNINSTLHDVEGWINQIQGVVKNMSDSDTVSNPSQVKNAYNRASTIVNKPNSSEDNS